jgi:hypothetical protein
VNFKGIPYVKLKESGIEASQLSYEILCKSYLKLNFFYPLAGAAVDSVETVMLLGLKSFKNSFLI